MSTVKAYNTLEHLLVILHRTYIFYLCVVKDNYLHIFNEFFVLHTDIFFLRVWYDMICFEAKNGTRRHYRPFSSVALWQKQ
jgi:hypothetical protein